MTEQDMELVERGIAAERLLNDPVVAKALNQYSDAISNSILNSAVTETDKREKLYMLHCGLKEMVATFQSWIIAKNQIEEQQKLAEENKDNE